jgi:superfamily I DNA/RNA helicase
VRHATGARLVLDGDFRFGAGAHVTTVDQVKGLEFDTVVVPDASLATYPDTPAARRALYVATTRARHQVVFATASAPSPLLAAPLARGEIRAVARPLDACFAPRPRAPE